MAEDFDPYRKWLGIPAKDQPPNHYRLLGIELFEDDPDVIEAAADQRMAHVRTYQTGQNSALSQKILNELSAAKLCLLDAAKKAAYDSVVRKQLAEPRSPASAKSKVTAAETAEVIPISEFDAALASIDARPHAPRSGSSVAKRRRHLRVPLILVSAALSLLLASSLVWLITANRAATTAATKVSDRSKDTAPYPDRNQRSPAVQSAPSDRPGPVTNGERQSAATTEVSPSVQPKRESTDRAVAEEVLRRGGQVRLLVNGQSIEIAPPASLPPGEFRIIEVRLLHADADRVADLSFLGRATKLDELSLADSRITPASLLPLARHPSLKRLNLEDTRLATGTLRRLLPIPQLEVLLLANCEITREDLRDLGVLKKLRVLGLQKARLGDDDMVLLRDLPELQVIHLYGVPIGDRGIKSIVEYVPRLQQLVISATNVTDDALMSLEAAKELKLLDLAGNPRLTGTGLHFLESLPALEWLKLDQTNVTDDSLKTIGKFTALKELLLSGNGITDAGLRSLCSLKTLTRLIANDTRITIEGIAELQKALPRCEIVANLARLAAPAVPEAPVVMRPGGGPESNINSTKRAVPDAEARGAAERSLKQRFKSQWLGGRDAAAKLEAARALVKAGQLPDCDSVEQFVLLSQAADLAAAAGDYSEANRIIAIIAEGFEVPLTSLLADALTQINRVTKQAEQKQTLVENAIALAAQAIEENDYQTAERVIKLAAINAKASAKREQAEVVKLAAKDISLLSRQYQRISEAAAKLLADPLDSEANLTMGRFECEFKRNWDAGLAHLAQTNDDQLRSIALADLSDPADPTESKKLADDWLRVAAKMADEARLSYQCRALDWLDQARAGLRGTAQSEAEKQMSDIKATAAYRNRPLRWLDQLGVGFAHEDLLDCFSQPHSFALATGFDLSKPWTLSLDFQANDFRAPGQIFFIGDDRGGRDPLFVSLDGHEKVFVGMSDAGASDKDYGLAADLDRALAGQWIHVRVAYEGSGNTVRLAVNGEELARGTIPFAPQLDRPMPIWIGAVNANDQRFYGKVRRILLRNVPRTPAISGTVIGRLTDRSGGIGEHSAAEVTSAPQANPEGDEGADEAAIILGRGAVLRLIKIPASADGAIKSFWLGQTEVTQAQWAAVMGGNVDDANMPKTDVALGDAKRFLAKLNRPGSRFRFRLPAPAEAEVAIGDLSQYGLDNTWCGDNSEGHAHRVATRKANRLGLFDIIGNVWEFCEDGWIYGTAYADAIAVLRVGLHRPGGGDPNFRNGNLGLRVAADLN
jgi:hypothetical protein